MALGLYISVPFCRTKCSYCNFASGVFSRSVFGRYVERLCADIQNSRETAEVMDAAFDPAVDTIYFGGGTPTLLDASQLTQIVDAIAKHFIVAPDSEITVECAPGTLTPAMVETFNRCRFNRVSLGVQSFVNQEAASVGRLHSRATVLDDISRLRAAGISNVNIDLIAGLPHQDADSWRYSVEQAIATGAPHISVYMFEVDEDSRLGSELIAGGTKYHAHFVPNEDLVADLYENACETLETAGIPQYEISNFARPGLKSKHNLKYWTRQPYLGFGVDAHSMLVTSAGAVRFSWPDSLERYLAGGVMQKNQIDRQAGLEETFFLGLRLTDGVDLDEVGLKFGPEALERFSADLKELEDARLVERKGPIRRLTPKGRLLSNEVFERFISSAV